MRYKVLEACISNVAINAVSSIDGSPQVVYDDGSSIYGLHVAEKAMRSIRKCQIFSRTSHLWRRHISSAYRPENRVEVTNARIRNELIHAGNYKPKHPVSVIGEGISELLMFPLSSEEEKPVDEVGRYKQKRLEQDLEEIEETGITYPTNLIYSFVPEG